MKKIFTLFAAALISMSMSVQAATPIADLNFEIKTGDTSLPENYVYSSANTPNIKVQNGVTCIIISDGGGSAAPTFNDPDEPSGGKRWMAFCPATDCSATISVMSNKKKFFIQDKNGEFFSYTNTANAVEEAVVENLKANQWYAMCGGSSQVYVTKIVFSSACTAPATPLSLKASKTSDIAVGDIITFSTEGGNGADITYLDGKNEIANPWTATAGAHSFTAVQDTKDGICGGITDAIEINVISHDSVSAAVVSGPAEVTVGANVTLSCDAELATNFQWFLGNGDKIEGADQNEYTFKAEETGEFSFYCEVYNEYNLLPVKSNVITVVVKEAGKVEGLLIKASAQREVTGQAAGSVDTNIKAGDAVKLNKKNYFGVKLADGYAFAEGDMFIINITTAADLGRFMLFADNEGKDLIYNENVEYSKDSPSATGDKKIALPAAAAGKTSIYLWREDGASQWNPTFAYIAVERGGDAPQAIDNTDAEVKAQKVVRNGQLFIEKNGVLYNAQGIVVR